MPKRYISSSESSETEVTSVSSESEQEDLCDYEKRRINNIRRNQEMMKSLGLTVKNPVDLQPRTSGGGKAAKGRSRRRKKATKRVKEDTDSEEEWQPWMDEVKSKPRRRATVKPQLPTLDPLRKEAILNNITNQVDNRVNYVFQPAERKRNTKPSKSLQQANSTQPMLRARKRTHTSDCGKAPQVPPPLPECFDSDFSDEGDFWGFPPEAVVEDIQARYRFEFELNDRGLMLFGDEDSSDVEENFKGFTLEDLSKTDIPLEPTHRYPKRGKELKTYQEEEISDDDDYLFCEDCDEIYDGDCPIHGPLRTLDTSVGWDKDSLTYTSVPVPAQMTVKTSDIVNAGLGVFAKEFIPRGVKVGPYEGGIVFKEDLDDVEDTSYMWEIHKEGQKPYFVDGRDASRSNWLRYVNCARHEEEQNMVAFQYKGQIYYRTFKHIYPGNELLVWYGLEYAQELGISVDPGMNPSYKCFGCGSTFVENCSFQIHLKHSASCAKAHPQVFRCFRCHQTFSELYQLQHHIRRHQEQNETENCHSDTRNTRFNVESDGDTCTSKKLFTDSPLTLHQSVCTGDDNVQTLTGYGGQDLNLKQHNRNRNSKKQYTCQHCGKGCSSSGQLQVHIRIHTGEKPYKCQHCGKGFNQSSHLQTHIRIHTGDKPYKCQHCGKGFSDSGNLQRHIRIHTGDMPYKCQHCGKGFNRSSSLQTHIRIHTGDMPYKCQHCGKGFSDSGNLQTHIRIHNGEKPYKCQHCGKGFSQSGSLQRHIRIHTGDTPYKCQHCGKGFRNSGSLQIHIRIHTGDKPYKCQHCGKGFSSSSHLQSHIRTHSRGKFI